MSITSALRFLNATRELIAYSFSSVMLRMTSSGMIVGDPSLLRTC